MPIVPNSMYVIIYFEINFLAIILVRTIPPTIVHYKCVGTL
jgi:hypothetical protein